jgi:choline kinase
VDDENHDVRDALIIAAGKGSRLAGRGDLKPLIPVLDVALIERVIGAGIEAGLRRFWIVTGYRHQELGIFLNDLRQRLGVWIEELYNDNWQGSNGVSVLRAAGRLDRPFVLLMSDHLFDPEIIRGLCRHPLDGVDVRVAVDGDTSGRDLIDIDDVTKVRVEDGRIADIGKHLSEFDAYDTGIFLCSPGLFDALRTVVDDSGDASLSDGIRWLGTRRRAGVHDIGELFWMDVDDGAMLDLAEQLMSGRS